MGLESDESIRRPPCCVTALEAAMWLVELTFGPTHLHHDVVFRLSSLYGSLVSAQNMMSEYNKVANVPLVFTIPSGCSTAEGCKSP